MSSDDFLLSDPAAVGLDAGRLRAVLALARQCIDAGLDAGISLFVARHGVPVLAGAVGRTPDGQPLTPQSRFLYLSASKPLTAAAVALLTERGLLAFTDPISRHIPEFGEGIRSAATVHHLLTHQAGIPDSFCRGVTVADWYDWKTATSRTCELPFEWYPGTNRTYHPLSYGLLGELVPRLDGRTFAEFFEAEVAKPLGMSTLSWGLPDPAAMLHTRLGLEGQDGLELARVFQTDEAMAAVIPAGNAWGTAEDLGRFYLALADAGAGWLAPATVARMTRAQTTTGDAPGLVASGYGLEVGVPVAVGQVFGELAGPRTFGHPGGRSTVGWCDSDTGVVAVILCNGMPDADEGQRRLCLLSDAVHRAVVDP